MIAFMTLFTALAAPTAVPGTSITLDPPVGFSLSDRYPGFTDGQIGSIVVTELAVPAADMRSQLSAEALTSKGMKELKRTQEAGREYVLVEQKIQSVTLHKWMLIEGDAEKTIMMVATAPANDARLPALRLALVSAVIAQKAHAVEMPFTIVLTQDFQPATLLQGMQLYTRNGMGPPLPNEAPRFMMGPSVAPMDAPVEAFAEHRVLELGLSKLRDKSTESIVVAGLPAYEIVVKGDNPTVKGGQWIYQLIIEEPSRNYVIAVGLTGSKADLDAFRAMARSYKPRKAP